MVPGGPELVVTFLYFTKTSLIIFCSFIVNRFVFESELAYSGGHEASLANVEETVTVTLLWLAGSKNGINNLSGLSAAKRLSTNNKSPKPAMRNSGRTDWSDFMFPTLLLLQYIGKSKLDTGFWK